MGVVEQAQQHKIYPNRQSVSEQEVALAVAWMRGEVGVTQIDSALAYPGRFSGNRVYRRVALGCREAFRRGLIEIKSSED